MQSQTRDGTTEPLTADHAHIQPSPIDSLPNELLAAIFKCGTIHRPGHDTHLAHEVLCSHVSRRWRNVAINLPTLWTRIHVGAHLSLLWIPYYLKRSKHCPLDVWIGHWGLDSFCGLEDRLAKITDIMNLLIPHIDRWSRLHIEGYYEQSTYLVLSHLDNLRAPVLRELAVDFEEWVESMEGTSFPLEILRGGAPSLTSVELDMILCCWPPRSALTMCTIHASHRSVACVRFIQLLASSPTLTKLRVHGGAENEGSWRFTSPSRTRLETLTSLWLVRPSHLTSTLLLAISAPRLETLRLEEVFDVDLQALFVSPQRSLVKFPALRTLSLNGVDLDDNSYIHLSRVLPSITHLKIRGAYPTDFQSLARLIGAPMWPYRTDARDPSDGGRVTADVIWPGLHTIVVCELEMDRNSQRAAIGNVLCDMLAARRVLGRPIERLVLDGEVVGMVEGTDGLRGYLTVQGRQEEGEEDSSDEES